MLYRFLADAVVLIHFLWILFLISGAVWGMRNRAVKIIHLSGLAFAFIIEVFNFYCPLTYIEVWARARHDPASNYAGSFIIYYMENLIYISLRAVSMASVLSPQTGRPERTSCNRRICRRPRSTPCSR